MLALAVYRGHALHGYLSRDHPVQVEILAACAELLGVSLQGLPIAVDGCGMPVLAVSLRASATFYARMAEATAFGLLDQIECHAELVRILTIPRGEVFNEASLASQFCQGYLICVSTNGPLKRTGAYILAYRQFAFLSLLCNSIALTMAHPYEHAQYPSVLWLLHCIWVGVSGAIGP